MSTDTLSKNSNSRVDAYDAAAKFPPYSVLMSVYEKENPSYLEEALLSMLNQSISPEEIVLVEDGPLTSELNETIDSFSSACPELFTIIKELYSMLDTFFMPSLYEGLPVSCVEAQAAGLHCVYSTDVPRGIRYYRDWYLCRPHCRLWNLEQCT